MISKAYYIDEICKTRYCKLVVIFRSQYIFFEDNLFKKKKKTGKKP